MYLIDVVTTCNIVPQLTVAQVVPLSCLATQPSMHSKTMCVVALHAIHHSSHRPKGASMLLRRQQQHCASNQAPQQTARHTQPDVQCAACCSNSRPSHILEQATYNAMSSIWPQASKERQVTLAAFSRTKTRVPFTTPIWQTTISKADTAHRNQSTLSPLVTNTTLTSQQIDMRCGAAGD